MPHQPRHSEYVQIRKYSCKAYQEPKETPTSFPDAASSSSCLGGIRDLVTGARARAEAAAHQTRISVPVPPRGQVLASQCLSFLIHKMGVMVDLDAGLCLGDQSGYWCELPGRHVDVGHHLDEEGDSKTTLSPRKKTSVLNRPPPQLVSGCRGPGTAGPGACCSPWGRPEPHGPLLGLRVPGQPRSGQQRAHAFVRVINSAGIVVNSLPNDCGQHAPSNRVMYVGGAHLMAEVKIISTSQILSQGTNGSPC